MPQVQVLPEVPSFGSQLAQVLNQVGGSIGKGLLERAKINKPITAYQDILTQQRNVDYKRKLESQVGTYVNKLLELSGYSPEKKTTIYADTMKNISEGMDIGSAVQSSLQNVAEQQPPKQTLWERITGAGKEPQQNISQPTPAVEKAPEKTKEKLKTISLDEAQGMYDKMPGKTHEQKLKNLEKQLTSLGYEYKK